MADFLETKTCEVEAPHTVIRQIKGRKTLSGNFPRRHYRFVKDYLDYSEMAASLFRKCMKMREMIQQDERKKLEYDRQRAEISIEERILSGFKTDALRMHFGDMPCRTSELMVEDNLRQFKSLLDEDVRRSKSSNSYIIRKTYIPLKDTIEVEDDEDTCYTEDAEMDAIDAPYFVGSSQAGQSKCPEYGIKQLKRNMFTKVRATYDQLAWTGAQQRWDREMQPSQRKAAYEKIIRTLINASASFLRFFEDNGFLWKGCNHDLKCTKSDLRWRWEAAMSECAEYFERVCSSYSQVEYDTNISGMYRSIDNWYWYAYNIEQDPITRAVRDQPNNSGQVNVGKSQSGVKEDWDAEIAASEEVVETNLVFEDDRNEEAEVGYTSGIDPKVPARSVVEMPANIIASVEKIQDLGQFAWNVTDIDGTNINQFVLPYALLPDDRDVKKCAGANIRQVISMYGIIRCDMEFFIKLNSLKTNAGILRMYWEPMGSSKGWVASAWGKGAYPHIFITASDSNSARLTIPWHHFRDFFYLNLDADLPFAYLGTLFLDVWSRLNVGEGGSTSVTGTIYGKFKNVELHQPRDYRSQTYLFSDKVRDDYYSTRGHQVAGNYVGRVQSGILDIVQEGSKILTQGADLVEKVMGVTNFLCDKPGIPGPPQAVIQRIYDPLVHGVGSENVIRMALEPNKPCNTATTMGISEDQLDIDVLKRIYAKILSFPVTNAMGKGSPVVDFPVTPATLIETITTGEHEYQEATHTWLSLLSSLFMFWHGTVQYRFTAVVADSHTLRLAMRFDPDTFAINVEKFKDCDRLQGGIIIWDVHEKNTFEVAIPYMSTRPWLRTYLISMDDPIYTSRGDPSLGIWSNGWFSMFIQQPLRGPSTVSDKVDILCEICGGEDLKFGVPSIIPRVLGVNFMIPPDSTIKFEGQLSVFALARLHFEQFREFLLQDLGEGGVKGRKAWDTALITNVQMFGWPMKQLVFSNVAMDSDTLLKDICSVSCPFVFPKFSIPFPNVPADVEKGTDSDKQIFTMIMGSLTYDSANKFMTLRPISSSLKKEMSSLKWTIHDGADIGNEEMYTSIMHSLEPKREITYVGKSQAGKDQKMSAKKNAKGIVAVKPTRFPTTPKVAPILLGKPRSIDPYAVTFNEKPILRNMLKRYACFLTHDIDNKVGADDVYVLSIPCSPAQTVRSTTSATELWNVTKLSLLTANFTFWKGSLRFYLDFTGFVSQNKIWIIYDPTSYGPFQCFSMPKYQVMQMTEFGVVLADTSSMKGIAVETPFYSPYGQLQPLAGIYDGTTSTGSLFVIMFPDMDLKVKGTVGCFHAIGEDFNMTIPRAPCKVFWPYLYTHNQDVIDKSRGNLPIKMPGIRTVRSWQRGVEGRSEEKVVVMTQPLNLPDQNVPNVSYELSNVRYVGKHQAGASISDISESGSDEDFRIEEESVSPPIAHDAVDGAIEGFLSAGKVLGDVGPVLQQSMGRLKNILDGLELGLGLLPKVEKVVNKMGETADAMTETSYDATRLFSVARIGVIVGAIYGFCTAETWPMRLVSLSGLGLALGVGPEMASNAVNWVFSNLGWEVPVLKVPQCKVNDVGTAQGVYDVLYENQDLFKWIGAGLSTSVFFMLFSKYPETDKVANFSTSWANKLKSFHFAGQAVKTAVWFFSWIGELLKAALSWAFDVENGGYFTRKMLADRCDDILQWVDDISALETEKALQECLWNPDRQQDLWKLMDQAKELFKLVQGRKDAGSLAIHITHGMRRLQSLILRYNNMSIIIPSRIDPFCMSIFGEPGIGKTAILNTIINYVGDAFELARHNRVFPRSCSDQYWSGYVGQPIVAQDDFAQISDSTDLGEFIYIKSNFGHQLNMGELNEKGRPFTSHFIFQTTNHPYPRPQKISNFMSIWRRRNLFVKATLVPGGTYTDDFKDVRFDIYNPMSDTCPPIAVGMKIDALINLTVLTAKTYLEQQRKRVWLDLNSGIVVPEPSSNSKYEMEAAEAMIKLVNAQLEHVKHKTIPTETIKAPLVRLLKTNLGKNVLGGYSEEDNEKLVGLLTAQGPAQDTIQAPIFTDVDARSFLKPMHPYIATVADRVMQINNRLEIQEAVKVMTATDEEIEGYIDSVYKNVNTRPTIADVKEVHNTVIGNRNGKRIASAVKDQYGVYDWQSYSSFMWDSVYKLETTGEYCIKIVPEDLQLEWDLGELSCNELNTDGKNWQWVCNQYFNRSANVAKETCFRAKLKEAISKNKAWVHKWFEDHPKIFKMMKVIASLSAMFLAWRALKWIMPDFIGKIEEKVSAWFGVVKESGPVSYVRDKIEDTGDKARALVNSISRKIKESLGYTEVGAVNQLSDEDITMIAEGVQQQIKMKAENKAYHLGTTTKAQKSIAFVPANVGVAQMDVGKAQGSLDPQASVLVENVIGKSLFTMHYTMSNGQMGNVNCLAVKGQTILAPWHAIMDFREDRPFHIRRGGVMLTFNYRPGMVVRLGTADAGLIVLPLTWPASSDITKHFIGANELIYNYITAELEVVGEGEERILRSHIVQTQPCQHNVYQLADGSLSHEQEGWRYSASTQPGDCGGILVAFNRSIQHKILGMHVAGEVADSTGFSVLITRELLRDGIVALQEQGVGLPLAQCGVHTNEAYERVTLIPVGNFTLAGVVPDKLAMGMPTQTKIRKSLIHGQVFEPVTQPSVLTPWDPRLEVRVSPMMQAISKYAQPTLPFPWSHIHQVTASLREDFRRMEPSMGKRLLTEEESVYGNVGIPYLDQMNMASSPGWPYIKSRPSGEKGKRYLFNDKGVENKLLIEKITYREQNARHGVRVESVWVDCLKDERRSLEKIRLGKTRQFTLPPVDFTLLLRKYSMAFMVAFYSSNVKSFSAVGIDPYSYAWTSLYQKLSANSNLAIAGDFSRFDGIADPILYGEIGKLINDWYDDSVENQKVRNVLFHELIHTNHLVRNLLYYKHQGNPSGNPLTVMINTVMVAYYMRLAWLGLAVENDPQKACIEEFRRNVAEIYYGDDSLMTVKGEVVSWYNQRTITEYLALYGIEYTDESKSSSDVPVRMLHDVTFLKNGFGSHPVFPQWKMAQMSKVTIQELFNWIHDSGDPRELCRNNVYDALKFAYFWGPHYYDELSTKADEALRNNNMLPLCLPYSYWDTLFRKSLM